MVARKQKEKGRKGLGTKCTLHGQTPMTCPYLLKFPPPLNEVINGLIHS
jgi:hypothetical protein